MVTQKQRGGHVSSYFIPRHATTNYIVAPTTHVAVATIIGLTIMAFVHSRAGAPTFGRLLEE